MDVNGLASGQLTVCYGESPFCYCLTGVYKPTNIESLAPSHPSPKFTGLQQVAGNGVSGSGGTSGHKRRNEWNKNGVGRVAPRIG